MLQLLLGDCLKELAKLEDNSIDIVVTDPPYLIDYRSNRRVKRAKFDYIQNDKPSDADLIPKFFKECYRVMKNNTSIFCFCNWKRVDYFKIEFEKYFKLKNIIIWEKNNHSSGDLKGAYAPKHEFVLFGDKGRNLCRRKRRPDVLNYDKVPSTKLLHPTEKNIKMLEDFILDFSDANAVVLDPFMGSGTTGVASYNTGRSFIGIEIDKTYYDIAKERIGG